MSFRDWFFGTVDNPSISGQWKTAHIITFVACILAIIAIGVIFSRRSYKARRIVLWVCFGVIFAFEITRRVKNMLAMTTYNAHDILYTLLPRPWCAISCWSLMLAIVVNKKWAYNYASITSLLCALIFFAYPSAGFNNKYILFENLYSIVTHSMVLVTSITFITLKFADFKYRSCWKEIIAIVLIFAYALLEMYALKISSDPLYFMPGNEVIKILGLSWAAYLPLYIVFMIVYFNVFYLIGDRRNVAMVFKRK